MAVKPRVDKSKRAEEVEERLCGGPGGISGWEVAGCGGGARGWAAKGEFLFLE